jgi:hypothetical protein
MLEHYYDVNRADQFDALFGTAGHWPESDAVASPVFGDEMGFLAGEGPGDASRTSKWRCISMSMTG